jgi:hypothetical protein
MSAGRSAIALIGLVVAGPTAAAEFDPAAPDLVPFIECAADINAYNQFAIWLTEEPDAVGKLGWQKVPTDNFFLEEYRLPAELSAFGRTTRSVAFTATGPMAIFDDVSPQDLAKQLELTAVDMAARKFMAEKVIVDTKEVDGDTTFSTYVTLNVSNVDTHPGKTLAGCSYNLNVTVAE